ncbi:MAG: TIGR02679 domain-containing protein [Arachnia sp.]
MSHNDIPVPDHITAWARQSGPSRVLADAFARFERGQALRGGVCRVELSEPERHQVGRILPATWLVSGQELRWRVLRAGLAANDATLESVVRDRCGPWRDVLQDRRNLKQEGDRDHGGAVEILLDLLSSRTGGAELPEGAVEGLRRGLFGRRTTSVDAGLIQRALEGLPPESGTVGLAVLAARVFGDAHALDRATALGRATARFARLEAVVRSGRPVLDATVSLTAAGWRAAWAGVGVVCDQVSSTVLVLNLPLVGDAPAVAIANSAIGEPVWLTLRSLAGRLSVAGDPTTVFVCENPSIVEAAADVLGASAQPLICTFGRPSAAALQLLRSVGSHTALLVQADSDATGRAIVDSLVAGHPNANPWRMPTSGVQYEEEIVDELLSDLRPPPPPPPPPP